MENLTQGHRKVAAIVEVLPAVEKAMDGAKQWLLCHDQEKQLMEAVERVLNLAQQELSRAYVAFRIHSEAALRRELMGLVFDAAAVLLGSQVLPQAKQGPMTPRLGQVLIAVGPEGVPGDLSVVNVSELADQEGKADSWVEKAITDKGYVLYTTESFKVLASWLQQEVLSGKASLPYHPESVPSPHPNIQVRKRKKCPS